MDEIVWTDFKYTRYKGQLIVDSENWDIYLWLNMPHQFTLATGVSWSNTEDGRIMCDTHDAMVLAMVEVCLCDLGVQHE